MTKINKLGKSTFLVAILSFLLVAVLAFGGTYAYFSATTGPATSGELKTGNLNIGTLKRGETELSTTENFTILEQSTDVAQPGQTIIDNETFSATATGNIAYYTRVKLDVKFVPVAESEGYDEREESAKDHNHTYATEAGQKDAEGEDIPLCADLVTNAIDALTIVTSATDTDGEGAFVPSWGEGATLAGEDTTLSSKYYYKLARTEADDIDPEDGKTEEFTMTISLADFLGRAQAGTAERCPYWMDATITVSITFEVLQADFIVLEYDDDDNEETDNVSMVAADGKTFKSGADAERAWKLALAQTNASGTETPAA